MTSSLRHVFITVNLILKPTKLHSILMKKTTLLLLSFAVSTLFVNCKSGEKSAAFSELTKSYFDDRNELNPLTATFYGQNQFNSKLQLEMTEEFRSNQKAFFDKYESELTKIDE